MPASTLIELLEECAKDDDSDAAHMGEGGHVHTLILTRATRLRAAATRLQEEMERAAKKAQSVQGQRGWVLELLERINAGPFAPPPTPGAELSPTSVTKTKKIYQYSFHRQWQTIRDDVEVAENQDGSLSCRTAGGRSTFEQGAWRVAEVPVDSKEEQGT